MVMKTAETEGIILTFKLVVSTSAHRCMQEKDPFGKIGGFRNAKGKIFKPKVDDKLPLTWRESSFTMICNR